MINSLRVASVMICSIPKYRNGRLILSCCDAVWDAIELIPDDIAHYFTDELGNDFVEYDGFLQIKNIDVIPLLIKRDLFICFRCVTSEIVSYVQAYPTTGTYEKISNELNLMGWDIASGNGWLSASCHGCFPINPFNGQHIDKYANDIIN